jgi:uncharacterized protein
MSTSRFRRTRAWWRLMDGRTWLVVRSYYLRVIGALLLLVVPLAAWGLWWEPNQLTIKNTTIAIPNWPAGFANIKVVALSDLHVGAPHITLDKMREVVRRANEQQPDLIVLLGDYVIQGVIGGAFVEPEVFVEILKELKAPLGVYAVLGNHDWMLGGDQVTRAFERVGIRMLTNEAVRIERNGSTLWLAGLGDYFSHKDDLEKTMRSVTSPDPIVALTHTPDIFLKLSPQFILTLAGHTHGGQVNLPMLGRRVVPSDFGEKYAIGFVEEGEKRLFVTSGIGTSILPVRFRVPPEISVLTIVRK